MPKKDSPSLQSKYFLSQLSQQEMKKEIDQILKAIDPQVIALEEKMIKELKEITDVLRERHNNTPNREQ